MLLVDDDPHWLKLLEFKLDCIAEVDYEVTPVHDSQQAKKMLLEQDFDVCLMDVFLGDDSGPQVVADLRKSAANTPVVLITASIPSSELEMEAVMSGAMDIIYKPELRGAELRRVLHMARLRRRSEQRLREATLRDSLTGVYNRKHITQCLEVELERHKRSAVHCSFLFIDLDNFKAINDNYGHAAGDHALQFVARIGLRQVRQTDCFARWGGDEFACLLPQTTVEGAIAFAEKIQRGIAAYSATEVERGSVAASIGVAGTNQGIHDVDALVQAADAAVYQAKHAGKNQVSMWMNTKQAM